jgi:hypothetical protein
MANKYATDLTGRERASDEAKRSTAAPAAEQPHNDPHAEWTAQQEEDARARKLAAHPGAPNKAVLFEDKSDGYQWSVQLEFPYPPHLKETLARRPGDINSNYWSPVWILKVGDEVIQESHFPPKAAALWHAHQMSLTLLRQGARQIRHCLMAGCLTALWTRPAEYTAIPVLWRN